MNDAPLYIGVGLLILAVLAVVFAPARLTPPPDPPPEPDSTVTDRESDRARSERESGLERVDDKHEASTDPDAAKEQGRSTLADGWNRWGR